VPFWPSKIDLGARVGFGDHFDGFLMDFVSILAPFGFLLAPFGSLLAPFGFLWLSFGSLLALFGSLFATFSQQCLFLIYFRSIFTETISSIKFDANH
jgi:hypothetical protein